MFSVPSIEPPSEAMPTVRPSRSATVFTGFSDDEMMKNGDNCAIVATEISGAPLLTRDRM